MRRLLKARIERDPSARAMGQGPEVADKLNTLMLMGMPEATIVTCVETWAQLRKQGHSDSMIASKIASFRGGDSSGGNVEGVIRERIQAEHGHGTFLPVDHVDWCIEQARIEYGV